MAEKRYAVKAIFGPTIQGEGSLTGRETSFLRFAGCNVWDGRPETRAASACPYCDTDFVGGDKLTKSEIVAKLAELTPIGGMVTVSGGEPLLQLDYPLAESLSRLWKVAVETNGTKPIGHDLRHLLHVTCSPKVPPESMALRECNDLKVLWPHPDPRITPEAFDDFPATDRWLQPVNHGDTLDLANVASTLAKVYELNARDARPRWGLSLQLHKVIGVE